MKEELTNEDKSLVFWISVSIFCLVFGLFAGGSIVKQDYKTLEYKYEKLEEDYLSLLDRNWNLQQQLLKEENK